jgi:hypothetical protein
LFTTIILYAILCPDRLFPESDKQIKAYEKGFKTDDHVIGETPEELKYNNTQKSPYHKRGKLHDDVAKGGNNAPLWQRGVWGDFRNDVYSIMNFLMLFICPSFS